MNAPAPKSASTPDRILDAATLRFAARGFEGTSLNDVADDVGIRTPSLYKHFEGKRALYVAVLDRLLAPYSDLLATLLVPPESAAQAEANVIAVTRHYFATPALARVVQHAALNGGDELELLVSRWYEPLFARAAELTPIDGIEVDLEDVMSKVIAVHSMMSGFVTMAPLHARLLGTDALGERAVAQQLEIFRGLAASFFSSTTLSRLPTNDPGDDR